MLARSEQFGGGEADLPYLCWKQIITPDAVEQPRGSYLESYLSGSHNGEGEEKKKKKFGVGVNSVRKTLSRSIFGKSVEMSKLHCFAMVSICCLRALVPPFFKRSTVVKLNIKAFCWCYFPVLYITVSCSA